MRKMRIIRKIDKTGYTEIIAKIVKIRKIVNKLQEGIHEKQAL